MRGKPVCDFNHLVSEYCVNKKLQPQHHNTTTQWPNIFIQSDGGCRYKGSSSTGWRIMAKYNNTTETTIEGGTLHPGYMCSFSIECIALYEALQVLVNICENAISVPTPPVVPSPHASHGWTLQIKGTKDCRYRLIGASSTPSPLPSPYQKNGHHTDFPLQHRSLLSSGCFNFFLLSQYSQRPPGIGEDTVAYREGG